MVYPQLKLRFKQVQWLFGLTLCLVVVLGLYGSGEIAIAQANPSLERLSVTAAMPENFPPQYTLDASNQPAGFAVDVMNMVADQANLDVSYQVVDGSGAAHELLESGQADLIPNMGITPKRQEKFAFTSPVETFSVVLFVRQSEQTIQNEADLVGHSVVTNMTNVATDLLQDRPGVDLQTVDTMEQALFELLAGKVDVLAAPEPVIWALAESIRVEHRLKVIGQPLIEIKRAIAVRKDNSALLSRLEPTVLDVVGSSKYKRIYTKWHSKPHFHALHIRIISILAGLLLLLLLGIFILQQLNRRLDLIVQQRTNQLQTTNQQLRQEIVERQEAEQALQNSEEQLRLVIDATNDAIWDWDMQKDTIFRSQRVYEFLGLTSVPEGAFDNFIQHIHPDDRDRVSSALKLHLENGADYDIELRLKRTDGSYGWFLDRGKAVRNAQDKPIRMVGALSDINARKQAETEQMKAQAALQQLNEELEYRVQQRTAQLETLNQELESFSYSVSHDLRAPLRHIHGFINRLQQQLEQGETLANPKVAHYLDVVDSSSQKMGQLIDGLLTLSRAGRQKLNVRPLNLRPLMDEAINLVTPADSRHKIQFMIGTLPTVMGDMALLQQVFNNLLSNAVKFSRDRTPAIIEIGSLNNDTIFIRDNGVGFSMDYKDQLFSAFQRLHSNKQFEGNGIGLSIVARIIHRHGGKIWADSQPDQGATFFLTLRKTDDGFPQSNNIK